MRDLLLLAIHLLVTLTKFLGPGGARQVVAESLLLTSTPDQQSLPTACAESHHARSPWARADYPLCEPTSHSEAIRDYQAGHAVQIPQGAGPSKIPSVVFLFPSEAKARTERPFHTTHRGHRRDEAPQSRVWLCPHCPANQSRFWYQNRQRCRASRACHTLSTQPGRRCPSWTHDRGVGHRGDAWKAIEGSQTGIAHDGRAPRFAPIVAGAIDLLGVAAFARSRKLLRNGREQAPTAHGWP
jgi:hypothetical protein